MNYWIITGMVVTAIGLGLSIVGTFKQQRRDISYQAEIREWKDKSEEYINTQNLLDRPELKPIGIARTGKNNTYLIIVKNTGKRSAEKVQLIYKDHGIPLGTSMIQGAAEIPTGTEYKFSFDVFMGREMIMSFPDTEENKKVKEDLQDFITNFQGGKIMSITTFYMKYQMDEEEFKTPLYMILAEPNRVIHLGLKDKPGTD